MYNPNKIYDVDLRPPYVRFVDRFFLFLILCLPFERAFIHDGEGAFLQYFVILFALFTIPIWRRYYGRWCCGVWLYFIFLIVGSFSDYLTCRKLGVPFVALSLRVWIMFYFLLVSYNLASRHRYYLMKILTFLLTFSVIVTISQWLGLGGEFFEEKGVEGGRVAVLGANLNASARDVSLQVIFGFLVFVNGIVVSRTKKLFIVGLAILSFGALIRTGSRGGLAALVCTLPIAVFTTKNISKKIFYVACVFVTLLLIGFVVMNTPSILDRVNKAVYSGDTGGREYIFHLTMYYWSLAKYIGHGCFAYQIVMGPEFGWHMLATHCTYTYALVSAGLVGGIFYYLFLIFTLFRAFMIRFQRYGGFLLLVTVYSLLGGITMNIEFTKWLYIIYGLIFAADRLSKKDKFNFVISNSIN